MKRNSVAGAGAIAVTATFAVLAISGPASLGAAKAKPKCPDKALCVWDDPGFEGQRVVVKGKELSNKIFDEMNDTAASAFLNRKSKVGVLYTDAHGGGTSICLYEENRWRIKDLIPYDNAISSSEVRRNLGTCLL